MDNTLQFDDYGNILDSTGNVVDTSAAPTNQTSSAGSDWTSIFGQLLNTGATVAGNVLTNSKKPAQPTITPAATAASSKTGYIIGGIAAVVLIVVIFMFKRK